MVTAFWGVLLRFLVFYFSFGLFWGFGLFVLGVFCFAFLLAIQFLRKLIWILFSLLWSK